jgi:hypothetical protein
MGKKIRGHGAPKNPKFIHSPHSPRHSALDAMQAALDRTAERRRAVAKTIRSLGMSLPLTRDDKLEVARATGLNLSVVTDACRALQAKEASNAKA